MKGGAVREERSPLKDAIDYRESRKDEGQQLETRALASSMESMIKEYIATLTKADQLLLFACDWEGVVVPDMIADRRCTYAEGGRVVEVGCRVVATGGSEKRSRVIERGARSRIAGLVAGKNSKSRRSTRGTFSTPAVRDQMLEGSCWLSEVKVSVEGCWTQALGDTFGRLAVVEVSSPFKAAA